MFNPHLHTTQSELEITLLHLHVELSCNVTLETNIVSLCVRWGGKLLSVPQDRVQWGKHWVLVGLWRIQDIRLWEEAVLQSQTYLYSFCWLRCPQRGRPCSFNVLFFLPKSSFSSSCFSRAAGGVRSLYHCKVRTAAGWPLWTLVWSSSSCIKCTLPCKAGWVTSVRDSCGFIGFPLQRRWRPPSDMHPWPGAGLNVKSWGHVWECDIWLKNPRTRCQTPTHT